MEKRKVRLVVKTILALLVFSTVSFSFISYFSKNVITYYDFNGVTITRIDRNGETSFFYGRCAENKSNCNTPFVKAKYSGSNSGLDGLLHFKADGYVEVISLGGGYFTEKRSWKDKLSTNNSENSTESARTLDSLRNAWSVIQFSNSMKLEKELNSKSNSKVNAVYPK